MCVCVNTHLVAMRRKTAFYNLRKKMTARVEDDKVAVPHGFGWCSAHHHCLHVCVCSLRVLLLLPTVQRHGWRWLIDDYKVTVGLNGSLSLSVSPLRVWQPVLGVSRLSSSDSLERLQWPPSNPELDKRKTIDGWA